jgi:ribonuclease P protein component
MLAKKYRITSDRDFNRVFKGGKRFFSEGINLIRMENGQDYSRFGFVVGSKVDKRAVIRNQVKRWMREAVRIRFDQVKPGFDVVMVADKRAKELDYEGITGLIVRLLDKSRLL